MYNKSVIFVLFSLLIATITATNLNSPCPDSFRYDPIKQQGEWSGTITLLSDTELYGIWVRLIFDKEIKQVTVDDNIVDVVASNNTREFLIKNRDVQLKAFNPMDIKITVKYDVDNGIPQLVEYRLNAKTVCTKMDSMGFIGDASSTEFVSNLLSHNKREKYTEFSDCGTIPLKESKIWPWQVSIYNNRDGKEIYLCQGTLISPKHILTTAHCVNYKNIELNSPPKHLIIHADRNNSDKSIGNLHVDKVAIYPGYRSNSLLNDIAIVTLKDSVNIDDNLRPICLTNNKNIDNEGILIQGLSQADVVILDEDECLDQSLITDNSICAAYSSGNSICYGDSGSGLVQRREKSKSVWELKGIVTFSAALQNVCDTSTKILLIDVGKYLKWIQSVIV